jgi:hypothetical protein
MWNEAGSNQTSSGGDGSDEWSSGTFLGQKFGEKVERGMGI